MLNSAFSVCLTSLLRVPRLFISFPIPFAFSAYLSLFMLRGGSSENEFCSACFIVQTRARVVCVMKSCPGELFDACVKST